MSDPQLSPKERDSIRNAPKDLVDFYVDIGGRIVPLDFSGRVVNGAIVVPFADKSDAIAAFRETIDALAPIRL